MGVVREGVVEGKEVMGSPLGGRGSRREEWEMVCSVWSCGGIEVLRDDGGEGHQPSAVSRLLDGGGDIGHWSSGGEGEIRGWL
jgi:hypothetical protein